MFDEKLNWIAITSTTDYTIRGKYAYYIGRQDGVFNVYVRYGITGDILEQRTCYCRQEAEDFCNNWEEGPVMKKPQPKKTEHPYKKIYISGKMTGVENFNHAKFDRQAKMLRDAGYDVFNPAEIDGGSTDKSREYYLTTCIYELLSCDSVMVLDDWRDSKGALLEVHVAQELGFPVFDTNFKLINSETICEEADRIVSGARGDDYGHPYFDFTRTGRMWAAILDIEKVTPRQVGMMMVALKLSRHCHRPKRDNLVDAAGYAKTVQMVDQYEKEHSK